MSGTDKTVYNIAYTRINMITHKEELKQSMVILERNIESPLLQCDSIMAMASRNATRSNYEAFINNEISREELLVNNNKIGVITRKFI